MSGEPTLEKGISSEWVVHLQQLMRDGGFWQGDTNGTFDDDLEQAVQTLQGELGLQQTGVVDDDTWSALEQRTQSTQQPAQTAASTDTSTSTNSTQPYLSDDGLWQWDGTQWQPVGSTGAADSTTQSVQPTSTDTTAATTTSTTSTTSTATDTSSNPTLSKGISSDWVLYLQQVMQHVGFWTGALDGSFGDDLEQAVQALQGSNGLQQTGAVDGQTWELLNYLQQAATGSGGQQQAAASIPVDPGLAVTANGHEYVIFTDEVREGGSVSWKARNPGNIRNGDSYGAYPGKKVSAGSSGHFAVFPDEATGFAAIKSVLHGYGHVTVAHAMSRYAPAGDGANDPDAYARQVANQMGVPVTTYVDQLSDDQLTVFATAIRRVEGWITGHTFSLTDPNLPDPVKHGINGN